MRISFLILQIIIFILETQSRRLIYSNNFETPSDIRPCVGKLMKTPNNIKQFRMHSGRIVADPLGGDRSVLTFSKITDSGDMFCGSFENVRNVGICIEYLGKISTNAESGGFLGLSKNYQNDVNWFFGASKHGYKWGSRIYKTMTDTNQWTEYCMNKTVVPDSVYPFSVAIEDWNYAGTTTKDAYFRNLRVYDYDQDDVNEPQVIQNLVEEYATDPTQDKPYNRFKLTWEYSESENYFHFHLFFPMPDVSTIWYLEEYELGTMVALFPFDDNSTSVSLIENFNPEKNEEDYDQIISMEEFDEHYPCVSTNSNQKTCYGQIYFFPKKIGEQTQYVNYRDAVANQLLRYDFEIQTTKRFVATTNTNKQSFSYNLTVKTLISDIPCEKCNCDSECTASLVLDASTYYTFTYCESFDDCTKNHSSKYTFGDNIVILIESKIGEHDFDIHAMYVYYPVADIDTVGDGYKLPRADIILQEKTSLTRKYTYKISQQAGYFEGKQAKLKILMANSSESRRLLGDVPEVAKIDYAITVNEDESVDTGATNNWNDVFEIIAFVFLGINIALLLFLIALGKRYRDISEIIKSYNTPEPAAKQAKNNQLSNNDQMHQDQQNQQQQQFEQQQQQQLEQQPLQIEYNQEFQQHQPQQQLNQQQRNQIIQGANHFESQQINMQAKNNDENSTFQDNHDN